MDFISYKALASALLPPFDLILVGVAGLLLLGWRRRTGIVLVALSLGGLGMLSLPVVATTLAGLIESRTHAMTDARNAQAIVILGGGSYADAPEYGADTVGAYSLERTRWGARLHRSTGLPILVTGGSPLASRTPEGTQMKAALEQDFRSEVKWTETRALTTFENARNAREILGREKIDRILLVTHALHMPRARLAFERAGFRVIEAPTGFSTSRPPGILNFLPSARAMTLSSAALHELVGLGWYHLRLAYAHAQGEGQ